METRKKLMVVDDTCSFRKLIKLLLSDSEFDVIEATNGSDALNILSDSKIDIVICDLTMPVMDGFGFLRMLKGDKKFYELRKIPVVMISGDVNSENIAKGNDLGANSWLSKPFNPLDLFNVIGELTATENIKREIA